MDDIYGYVPDYLELGKIEPPKIETVNETPKETQTDIYQTANPLPSIFTILPHYEASKSLNKPFEEINKSNFLVYDSCNTARNPYYQMNGFSQIQNTMFENAHLNAFHAISSPHETIQHSSIAEFGELSNNKLIDSSSATPPQPITNLENHPPSEVEELNLENSINEPIPQKTLEISTLVSGEVYKPKVISRICENCKHIAYGRLCGACETYKYKNGFDRPKRYWKVSTTEKISSCSNCGVISNRKKCKTCTSYRHFHGVERPQSLWNNSSNRKSQTEIHKKGICKPKIQKAKKDNFLIICKNTRDHICTNCKATETRTWYGLRNENGKICSNCYKYRYRHGKNRPERLWNEKDKFMMICRNTRDHICTNCKATETRIWYGSGNENGKICANCYKYRYRNGKNRPERCWNAKKSSDNKN